MRHLRGEKVFVVISQWEIAKPGLVLPLIRLVRQAD